MICSKISKSLYIINRTKNFLPKKSLLTLYYALIHSHLSYCTAIYGCANKTILKKLFLKQKKAIRIISNANFCAHTSVLFKELKILPLDKMITFCKIKFMHKFTNKRLPLSFANMWETNRSRMPERNLRNADNFFIVPHHFENLKRMPLFSFPSSWNDEDANKLNPNLKQYLKTLKNKLLQSIT
jgi:hypothetical protein